MSNEGLTALLGAYGSDSESESAGVRAKPDALLPGEHRDRVEDGALTHVGEIKESVEPIKHIHHIAEDRLPPDEPARLAQSPDSPAVEVGPVLPCEATGIPGAQPGASPLDFLPPELKEPSAGCDPEVQDRVRRWLALQAQGRHLITELRKSRDYRNPEFFKKMVEYWEIDEHGTLFPQEVFDPGALPLSDSLEALQREWAAEEERRRALRASGVGRIEFTGPASQTTLASSAVAAAQAKAAELAAAARIRR